MNQETGPHQTLNLPEVLTLDFPAANTVVNTVVYSHPAYGILLEQAL